MSEQDALIREAQKETRRIISEAMTQWMAVRHAAGHADYVDKVAMRQVKLVVTRALTAGAEWRDVQAAVARCAARPADRKGYVYALDDEIGRVAQERRERERSEMAAVQRERDRMAHDAQAGMDLAALLAKYPGTSLRLALIAEGLDPFRRPA